MKRARFTQEQIIGGAVPALRQRKPPSWPRQRSDQVGRNYMRHNNATVLAISRKPNPTQFQKTLGLNDFYHGHALSPANDWEFPLGHIQMVGKSDGGQIDWKGRLHFFIGCRSSRSIGSRVTRLISG